MPQCTIEGTCWPKSTVASTATCCSYDPSTGQCYGWCEPTPTTTAAPTTTTVAPTTTAAPTTTVAPRTTSPPTTTASPTTSDACTGSSSNLLPSDCDAWKVFYDSTTGEHWDACNQNRLDPCACSHESSGHYGIFISCSRSIITEVSLWHNNLTAQESKVGQCIPKLTGLSLLDLRGNKLGGTISGGQISLLISLKNVSLNQNQIEGTIPWQALSKLTSLEFLDLSGNRLTGSISTDNLNNLRALDVLALNNNYFEGTIPFHGLSTLSVLTFLDLGVNKLSGGIPGLNALTSLTTLRLQQNMFTGVVPDLRFEQYRQHCNLQDKTNPSNQFACPLPSGSRKCSDGPPTCVPTTTAPISTTAAPPTTTAAPTTTVAPVTTTAAPDTTTAAPTFSPTATNAASGTGPTAEIALGCVVTAAVAAAMCFYNSRRRRSERMALEGAKGSLQHPLLHDSTDFTEISDGAGAGASDWTRDFGSDSAVELHDHQSVGVNAGVGTDAEEAVYCGGTGAPVNAVAEAEVAREWRTGESASGGRARVVQLQFDVLARATDSFDERKNIGGGASCAVYQGQVFGVGVAVKRLNDGAVEWEAKQYASEMALLIAVSHENICRLLAFSSDGPSKCLVLELCLGGSLDHRLRQPVPTALTWQQRLRIAQQVARALTHLHSIVPQIVHRDVKSANVLLDAAGTAKVADFGTVREGAKPGEHGTVNTHAKTSLVVGTKGYMPPEYEKGGHVSVKTDSYAFGIVLLELLTGKVGLVAAALHVEEPDLFEEMMDHVDARAGRWPAPVVAGLAAAVERCIAFYARSRATVAEVLPQLGVLPL
jgi:hypothetical protein